MVQDAQPTPDGQWYCCADGCTNVATEQWQRLSSDGTDRDAVFSCDTHVIDTSLLPMLHQATCTAPPTCDCTPISNTEPVGTLEAGEQPSKPPTL